MVSGCRPFPTQPIQWWLSADVWWFSIPIPCWAVAKPVLFWCLKKMLRLATSMTSPSLVLFFAKGYGPRHLETDLTRGEGGWGMEMIPIDSRENRGSIMRRYGNSINGGCFLREKNGDIVDVLQQCLITGTLEDLETQKWWKSRIDLTSRWKEQLQRTELSTFKFLWASWMIS